MGGGGGIIATIHKVDPYLGRAYVRGGYNWNILLASRWARRYMRLGGGRDFMVVGCTLPHNPFATLSADRKTKPLHPRNIVSGNLKEPHNSRNTKGYFAFGVMRVTWESKSCGCKCVTHFSVFHGDRSFFFQDIRKHVYTFVCNNFSRSLFKLKPKL